MSQGRRSSPTIATMRAEACSTASHIRWLLARTGVLPGSAMPSASHAMCMVFAVPMPGHTPGPRMAFSLISVSSGSVTCPLARCAGGQEHVLDVAVTALVAPAGLVAAPDDDRRDVEPRGRHQLPRRGLVAGRQAEHAVELGPLDGHLDVVHDQVARGQDVTAAVPRAGDEVARRRRAHLERHAPARSMARFARPAISSRWLKQIARAEDEFTIAILGLAMSSSVRPSARHCARRVAQRDVPSSKLLRSAGTASAPFSCGRRAHLHDALVGVDAHPVAGPDHRAGIRGRGR